MKTKTAILLLVCIIFLAACGGVAPYPTPLVVSPTLITAPTKSFPTATNTLTRTPIPWQAPTPETLYGYPTPEIMVLPTCGVEGCWLNFTPEPQRRDITFHELYVGKYVLRNWCDSDPQVNFFASCAVVISSKNTKQVEIWGYGATTRLREETGANLTGNGIPDIVIGTWDGAADGGSGTIIYEAGDTLKKIMFVGSQDPGTFTDLNNDGSLEYVAPTRIFSRFCLDCQVSMSIVYEYQGKIGYVPATYKFKDKLNFFDDKESLGFLAQFTKQHPKMAFHFLPVNYYENPSIEDKEYQEYEKETNWEYSRAVNILYALTAHYLLIGQKSEAQNILNEYFPPDKASEYMSKIQKDLSGLLAP